uniref:NADH-ubiquinone oxidoreductase chain 4 n=1 Tax=Phoronopsis harmeri TaxID=490051 RepID=J9PPV0_9BILA|nr:NADH dehydrogenase subunit 4 [Phoronopsis harmeri]AES86300.1 NADH dehydrogenase subunit 4 [Phoronopsis harmeri]
MLKIFIPASSLLLLLTKKNFWEPLIWFSSYALIFMLFSLYSPLTSVLWSSLLFYMDVMSISLILLSLWILILMLLASYKTLWTNFQVKEFCFWSVFLTILLFFSFSLSSALLFYFSFEACLIPIMVMILGWGYQPERLQASSYLIMYTVTASLPLLLILFKFSSNLGSLNFLFMEMSKEMFFSELAAVFWALTILAFLVKMPMFLFHLWLPKAHVEAPVAGSMVLAGVLLKLGSYGLLRMASIFPLSNISFFSIISSISLWGAVITGFICMRQVDMKALIAYSSVGHMGLLLAGTLSGCSWGWESSLLMMISHGICSSGMFMLANVIYEKSHNRSLFLTKGLLTIFPYLSLWWFLLNIVNMAAPPSLNLVSELLLVASIMSCSGMSVLALSIISFIAAGYSLYLFSTTTHGSISSYISLSLNIKSREYLNMLIHWIPLNLLVLKLDVLLTWL